jgi:apolipoprotein N-acyltransferase
MSTSYERANVAALHLLLAALSGFLSGLSLMFSWCFWLAWLAPALFLVLLFALNDAGGRGFWKLGLAYGIVYNFTVLSGLIGSYGYLSMPTWQALPLLVVLVLLLALVLSLPICLAAAVYGRLAMRLGYAPMYWALVWYVMQWLQEHIFDFTAWGKLSAAATASAFPVVNLGVSQGACPALLQSASIWGVNGLTFLIIFVNALLAAFFLRPRLKYIGLAALLFVLNLGGGLLVLHVFQTADNAANGLTLQVAAAHSDVSYADRWSGLSDDETYAAYVGQIEQAAANGAQLILLPETALPYTLQADGGYGAKYLQLAAQNDLTLIVGGFSEHDGGTYNSLFAAYADGGWKEFYAKRALVPFGEYIPLRGLLNVLLPDGFWESFPNSDLQRGSNFTPAVVKVGGKDDETEVAVGSFICYDLCFSDYPRDSVLGAQQGAEILLGASNDVWYANSPLVYLHLNHAVLRAAEYGRYLINSTNGGYSAIISNRGEILSLAEGDESAIAYVRPLQSMTIFAKTGDLHIYTICVMLVIVCIFGRAGRRRGAYKINSLYEK